MKVLGWSIVRSIDGLVEEMNSYMRSRGVDGLEVNKEKAYDMLRTMDVKDIEDTLNRSFNREGVLDQDICEDLEHALGLEEDGIIQLIIDDHIFVENGDLVFACYGDEYFASYFEFVKETEDEKYVKDNIGDIMDLMLEVIKKRVNVYKELTG